ncbi:MAG TPA: low molecular weight protein-tyrosine-phosphatase [Flavobacteriaceae bacterium]|nr:low molecular weight protein-tyrosine-phosphatase [Flavobacteriaceae bacterium]
MNAGKTNILMVCLGNICRSPLAEGILKSKLPENLYFIDSAGTGGWHAGEAPDRRSIQVARKFGIDISNQRARQIHPTDFEKFDIIFAMDHYNKRDLLQMAPNSIASKKVTLILDYLKDSEKINVPDPYYGNERDFEHVFYLLDEVCEIISKNLIK